MTEEIIIIKANLFAINQTYFTQDRIGTKNTTHVSLDYLPHAICSEAANNKINHIKIFGNTEFCEEIKSNILNYLKHNYQDWFLNIEIIEENY